MIAIVLYSAIMPKSENKYVVKVFNWPEVHLSEMTCYKIHTLAGSSKTALINECQLFIWSKPPEFFGHNTLFLGGVTTQRQQSSDSSISSAESEENRQVAPQAAVEDDDDGVVHHIFSPISNSESTNFFQRIIIMIFFQLENWKQPPVFNQ